MVAAELMMPRRKEAAEPEGRKSRIRSFTRDEMREIAATLVDLGGQVTALVDSLEEDEMETLATDGGEKPGRGIELVERWIGLARLAYTSARRRR